MFAKFNLNAQEKDWNKLWKSKSYSEYLRIGKEIFSNRKRSVGSSLDKFKNANEELEASEIASNLFSAIDAHIFISHSHADEDLVIALAGWLSDAFKINCFVDSMLWEHIDNLQEVIDREYCKKIIRKDGSTAYEYKSRNRSTSHVHALVINALSAMIYNCESLIFVNTSNSFCPAEHIKTMGSTFSPWIYTEIAMAKIIQKRAPEEHRLGVALEALGESVIEKAQDKLKMKFKLDMLELASLSIDDLAVWSSRFVPLRPKYRGVVISSPNTELQDAYKALDFLYEFKKIKDDNI